MLKEFITIDRSTGNVNRSSPDQNEIITVGKLNLHEGMKSTQNSKYIRKYRRCIFSFINYLRQLII